MPNEDITLVWVFSSAAFCDERGSNSLLPAMLVAGLGDTAATLGLSPAAEIRLWAIQQS